MDSYRKAHLFLLLFFLAGFQSWGQETIERDNELWSGISLRYKLNKKIQFGLDQQVRMSQNMNAIRSSLFEFSARYRFNKHFSLKGQYRYTIRNGNRNVNRFTMDANLKWKWKKADLTFEYRARFQHSMVVFTGEPASYFRNRPKLSYYGFKKIEPFISYENFYKFNQHNEFRGHRYLLGVDIKLNKDLDLTLSYGIDQETNTKSPNSRNLFVAVLKYDF